MADSESAALTGLGDTPVLGAVGETRTLMTLATATSRLRVYQFRHDRISDFNSQLDLRLAESSELYIGFRTLQAFSEFFSDHPVFKRFGRGSRIRTYEWRIQNPLP